MKPSKDEVPQTAKVVERNVNALLHRKKEEDRKRNFQERMVDAVTAFAGSMLSLYIHLIFFGTWITWNSGWTSLKPFYPSFIILATFAAVEAIFLTTFVLIGQKRMNIQADKWAELDLQVSLLTEHELTRIMNLITAIAKKMEIEEAHDEEIEELSKDIHPEKVLDTIEKSSK
jgi:uncharacterized membrane protein